MSYTPSIEQFVNDRRQELLDAAIRQWMMHGITAASGTSAASPAKRNSV